MKSLRAQLTLRLLIGGAFFLAVVGGLLHWQMRRALTAEFDISLIATLNRMTMLVEQKRGRVSIDFTGADISQLERADGTEFLLLRSNDSHEITRSRSLGTTKLPLRAGSLAAPKFFNAELADGRAVRCAGIRFTPEYDDETPRPPQVDAILIVGLTRVPLDRALTSLGAILLLLGAGALAALSGLVYWGVRAGLAPLDRLGASVAAVDADSLATRFPVEPLPAELQPIVSRLNDLLSRLESAFQRERRFTATAAHELRTPLAELRALAEVSLNLPATEKENTQSWRDALDATLRMESLALRLLDLARAEDPALRKKRTSVSLTQALTEAWRPWAGRAAARGQVVQTNLQEGLTAHTDPTLLAVVLGNLCGNAATHAPDGTPITVQGHRATDGVTLAFRNQSEDLTASDLPHLFERFWRKDGARVNGQHHGLGLALVAEFVELLNGRLSARLVPPREVEFTLWLPD